ncbi:hypothetical protein Q7P35_011112 [Cladosporium inversicolor]
MTYISTSSNTATILFAPDKAHKTYTLISNSSRKQTISAQIDDDAQVISHEITGEGTKAPPSHLPENTKNVVFTFSYEEESGGKQTKKPSFKLKSGGPYDIGRVQLLVVVAENGDDADFNDAVVQITVQ